MTFVIGLAGGIASGKSLVAECFSRLGAVVLNADHVGHQVLLEPEVKEQIRQIWGEVVFENGEVSRRAVAAIVFDPETGPVELAKLENIVHPAIKIRLKQRLGQLRTTGSDIPAVVLDAPVMFKAGWDELCDRIVFVDAPAAIRKQRTIDRGWSDDELEKRETQQLPLDVKRQRSTDLIDNSTTPEATFLQVQKLWQQWGLPAAA